MTTGEGFDLGFDADPIQFAANRFIDAVGDLYSIEAKIRQGAVNANANAKRQLTRIASAPLAQIRLEAEQAMREAETVLASTPQATSLPADFDSGGDVLDCITQGPNGEIIPIKCPTPELPTGEDPIVGDEPTSEPPTSPPDSPTSEPPTVPGGCDNPIYVKICDDDRQKPPPPPETWFVWKKDDQTPCRITRGGTDLGLPGFNVVHIASSEADATAWARQNCAGIEGTDPDSPKPPDEPGSVYCLFRSVLLQKCVIIVSSGSNPCPGPGAGTWEKLGEFGTRSEAEAAKSRFCDFSQRPEPPTPPDRPDEPPTEPPTEPPKPPKPPSEDEDGPLLESCSLEWWQEQLDDKERLRELFEQHFGALQDGSLRKYVAEQIVNFLEILFPAAALIPGKAVTIEAVLGLIYPFVNSIGGNLSQLAGCNDPAFLVIALVNMVMSFFQKYLITLPPAAQAKLSYSENILCQYLFPTTAEAENAWLANEINDETLETLIRLNGDCLGPREPIRNAKRSKISPGDLARLKRRGLISEEEYKTAIREAGFIREAEATQIEQAAEFVPGPADIIRLLQRDVFDTAIVTEFKLESEFEKKFWGNPDVKDPNAPGPKLARAAGISEDNLREFWKAHWEIPSPTQLSTFRQRLREPRIPSPSARAQTYAAGGPPKWSPRADSGLTVTDDQIRQSLVQQDILPFWVDRFMAVQYMPLTRVDSRRAFEIGVLDAKDVFESLVQNGYDDENAAILTDFAVKEKDLGIANTLPVKQFRDGLIPKNEAIADLRDFGYSEDAIIKVLTKEERNKLRSARSLYEYRAFVSGEGDEKLLVGELQDRFYDPGEIREVVERAQREVKSRLNAICVSGIHERYLRGELTDAQSRAELDGLGVNVFYADELVKQWRCEREAKDHLPRLRELADWFSFGIIDAAELDRYLENLRYGPVERGRFIAQIRLRIQAAAAAEEAKRLKELERAEEKARRQREAERRRQQAQGERQRQAARREKREAERLAIAIQKAAEKWAVFTKRDLEQATLSLQEQLLRVRNETNLDEPGAVQVIVRAVEWGVKDKTDDLQTLVNLIGEDVLTSREIID